MGDIRLAGAEVVGSSLRADLSLAMSVLHGAAIGDASDRAKVVAAVMAPSSGPSGGCSGGSRRCSRGGNQSCSVASA